MPQRDVMISTADGTCDASLHTPEGAGPWAAVIMYPDAGGVRGTFHEMAQQLADLGYAVLLPNLYYRTAYEPFDLRTVFSDKDERARLMDLAGSVTEEMAARDTEAMLTFLAEQPEVAAGTKVGTTGYCMGGSFALTAAGRYPDRVGAAASFHGGQIASTAPDSPHSLAGAMQATIYIAGAEHDASFDDGQFERMSSALTDAGVTHTLVTYAAAHGFAVPDNPTYDEAAAARHWQALEDLYTSTLDASDR